MKRIIAILRICFIYGANNDVPPNHKVDYRYMPLRQQTKRVPVQWYAKNFMQSAYH